MVRSFVPARHAAWFDDPTLWPLAFHYEKRGAIEHYFASDFPFRSSLRGNWLVDAGGSVFFPRYSDLATVFDGMKI